MRHWASENPSEVKWLGGMVGVFLLVALLPFGTPRLDQAILEGFALLHWYAREHVILCLLPALVIAGAIAVFVQRQAILRYLGPRAPKPAAYTMASLSGGLLAVCSCTILPLFGGIYRRGAGLGPAITFLYAGPAINVLAVVLTAKVLGFELGLARALGAILFGVVIGLIMHGIYRREERARAEQAPGFLEQAGEERSLGDIAALFGLLVAILIFANWSSGPLATWRWLLTALAGAALALLLVRRFGWHWPPLAVTAALTALLALLAPQWPELAFSAALIGLALAATTQPGEGQEWLEQSWMFAKLILPLLLVGVLLAGLLLGRPGEEGLIPSGWVAAAVGGNGLLATFFAALAGALMYFATLTEVPIVQGLVGAGMGQGPALALLLAGPALSLPNLLVIRSIIGTEKSLVYAGLVVVMATLTGYLYGSFYVGM